MLKILLIFKILTLSIAYKFKINEFTSNTLIINESFIIQHPLSNTQ